MADLPPFPVDEGTLGLLEAAMDPRSHGDPAATQASVSPLLEIMSWLGGSDVGTRTGDDGLDELRGPLYTERCVIRALIGEVRRLRAAADG